MIISSKPLHRQRQHQQEPLPQLGKINPSKKTKTIATVRQQQTTKPTKEKKNALPVINPTTAGEPVAVFGKAHESLTAKALRLLGLPPNESSSGSIQIKFNHYNKSFPVLNGVVKWVDIDSEYAFSFVYRGNYGRVLNPFVVLPIGQKASEVGPPCTIDETGEYFLDVKTGQQYMVTVIEDPVAGVGAEGFGSSKPYLASTAAVPVASGNTATQLLTGELLAIDPSRLNGNEARDLIERRDIEDILFCK